MDITLFAAGRQLVSTMKKCAVRMALLALLLLHAFAQDVPITRLEPDLGNELGFMSNVFETTPATDQVMVVRVETTGRDGKKSAIENVLVSSKVPVRYTISLIDCAATNPEAKNTYIVVDNGHRQTIRDAHLVRSSSGDGLVWFKFSDGQMRETPQANSWKIRLEKYETVKARHPDLPAPPKLNGWSLSSFVLSDP